MVFLRIVLFLTPSVFALNSALAYEITQNIRIDGSSTVYPITEAVAEEFQQINKDAKITIGVSGTGGGYKKFVTGEIDIANASRPITTEEINKAKANQVEFIELPVAYDGLTVIINPKNSFVKKLTMAQLKSLWEPGSKVRTWKDLDPSWPSEAIKLYGPGADSGTFEFFTEQVVGKSKASRTDYTASEDDNVVVKGVSGDVNALGYLGYAYYLENKGRLAAVALEVNHALVELSDETISSGKYPLSRLLFITVNKRALINENISSFLRFYVENGKTLVQEVGYTPLSDGMYAIVRNKLETKATGIWQSH